MSEQGALNALNALSAACVKYGRQQSGTVAMKAYTVTELDPNEPASKVVAQGPAPFTVAWALMDMMDETALRTLASVAAIRVAALNKGARGVKVQDTGDRNADDRN